MRTPPSEESIPDGHYGGIQETVHKQEQGRLARRGIRPRLGRGWWRAQAIGLVLMDAFVVILLLFFIGPTVEFACLALAFIALTGFLGGAVIVRQTR